MNIIGPEALAFGVDDVDACTKHLSASGLAPVDIDAGGGRFEALDGTAIVVRRRGDPSLPAPLDSGSMLRQTVMAPPTKRRSTPSVMNLLATRRSSGSPTE